MIQREGSRDDTRGGIKSFCNKVFVISLWLDPFFSESNVIFIQFAYLRDPPVKPLTRQRSLWLCVTRSAG